jgi:uncharacterized protein (DUF58 family)
VSWSAADAPARAAAACARLRLHVGRGMGARLGEHRVPGRPQPSGIEVDAFRAYSPGDDLRHLDWSAVARLDTLVVRRFTAERELRVHLLVDASASMAVPARDRKLDAAREIAMALSWMALATGDTVTLEALGPTGPPTALGVRHRTNAPRVAAWLDGVVAAGTVDVGAALAAHARAHPRPAVVFVLSDLMAEPATFERGLGALRAARHAVVLLHVIGPGELDPAREMTHGVLEDVESGATHPIALTASLRARYDALLAAHLAALEAMAARAGAAYVRVTSDEPPRAVVAGRLGRMGLVRRR